MEKITSKQNSALKSYLALAQHKKYRVAEHSFVLEGLRLCLDACRNGLPLRALFFTEKGLSRWQEKMPLPENTPCRLLSDDIASYLAQTEQNQGVFAVAAFPPQPTLDTLIHAGGHYLVLYHLQDPGNLGTILRTADAFGIDGLICIGCCDAYAPKVVRAAMGALLRLPLFITRDHFAVFSAFREKKIETFAAVVQGNALSLGTTPLPKDCAIVIGNEGNGLPLDIIEMCEKCITIPMRGNAESLCAAEAAGIFLWELQRMQGDGNV